MIDLSVGLELKKKVGDYVEKGETLAVLHANDQEKAGQAEERSCVHTGFPRRNHRNVR